LLWSFLLLSLFSDIFCFYDTNIIINDLNSIAYFLKEIYYSELFYLVLNANKSK